MSQNMDDSRDSEDYILQEIRMKYAEDFEEILECPVCFEIPKGEVSMCVNGHHLCCNCKSLLANIGSQCPTCEGKFTSCRNYAVEKLCQKFEDIKSSMLDPRHASNRRVIKNKASVYVQTEEVFMSEEILTPALSNKSSATVNNNVNSKAKSDPLIITANNNVASVP